MGDSNIIFADQTILPHFERKAFTIINKEKQYFEEYFKKKEEIDKLFENEEFKKDWDTFKRIVEKYKYKFNVDLPTILGYRNDGEFIGYFELDGKIYVICEEFFDTEEGIKVIQKILDFFEFDYTCKKCLVKRTCKVLDHAEECEGTDELYNNPFIYDLLAEIIGFSTSN